MDILVGLFQIVTHFVADHPFLIFFLGLVLIATKMKNKTGKSIEDSVGIFGVFFGYVNVLALFFKNSPSFVAFYQHYFWLVLIISISLSVSCLVNTYKTAHKTNFAQMHWLTKTLYFSFVLMLITFPIIWIKLPQL